jgi:hypothetical protein
MGPTKEWIGDWIVGCDVARERETGNSLLEVFSEFWRTEELDRKSKTTQRRYSGGLHALGGYLVEQVISEDEETKSMPTLLWEAVDLDEGPLVFHDHEGWQRELDTVCRRLHRYLKAKDGAERTPVRASPSPRSPHATPARVRLSPE